MIQGKRQTGVVVLLLMVTLAVALGGCAARRGPESAPGELPIGSRISLPGNAKALGEVACEFYKAGEKQNLEQFEIRCPGWERPAGQV